MRKDRHTQIEMKTKQSAKEKKRFFSYSMEKKNKNNLEEFMCVLSQLFLSRHPPPTHLLIPQPATCFCSSINIFSSVCTNNKRHFCYSMENNKMNGYQLELPFFMYSLSLRAHKSARVVLCKNERLSGDREIRQMSASVVDENDQNFQYILSSPQVKILK